MLDLPITYRGVVYPWQCDPMGHMNVRVEEGVAIVVRCRGKVNA